MKYLPIIIVLSIISFFSFKLIDQMGYISYGSIHQRVSDVAGDTYYSTHCWKDGDIVKTWLDPIDSVLAHPDLPKQRREMGKVLLKSLR